MKNEDKEQTKRNGIMALPKQTMRFGSEDYKQVNS